MNFHMEPIDVAWANQCRGTDTQTATGLPFQTPYILNRTNSDLNDYAGGRIAVHSLNLHNRSGSSVVVAFGGRIANKHWAAGQWTNTGAVGVDDTTDAQDEGAADDFALETTTANSGHYFACDIPFNFIAYRVSTASVKGTTVARALRYSTSDSAWGGLATNVPYQDGAADDLTTGEECVCFIPPHDWARITSAQSLFTTVPLGINGRYILNVRATDAPDTTAALARSIELWRMFYVTEGLADNGSLDLNFTKPFLLPKECDAFGAFFSVANAMNRVTAQVGML